MWDFSGSLVVSVIVPYFSILFQVFFVVCFLFFSDGSFEYGLPIHQALLFQAKRLMYFSTCESSHEAVSGLLKRIFFKQI